MRFRSLLLALSLAVLLCGGGLAMAQGTVTYDGHEIEPDDRPVECLFWDRDEVRHEDPNGVTLDVTGTGLIIIDDVEHGELVAGKVALDPEDIQGMQVGDDCTDLIGGD